MQYVLQCRSRMWHGATFTHLIIMYLLIYLCLKYQTASANVCARVHFPVSSREKKTAQHTDENKKPIQIKSTFVLFDIVLQHTMCVLLDLRCSCTDARSCRKADKAAALAVSHLTCLTGRNLSALCERSDEKCLSLNLMPVWRRSGHVGSLQM